MSGVPAFAGLRWLAVGNDTQQAGDDALAGET